MRRRAFLLLGVSLARFTRSVSGKPEHAPGATAFSRSGVRIGVFGLFHPRELIVRSATEREIVVRTDRDTCVLRGREEARVLMAGRSVEIVCAGRTLSAGAVRISAAAVENLEPELRVPGRIARRFGGAVDVVVGATGLVAVVSMDLETAVASVVAAEQAASTAMEALEAQAVAARSYFTAARGRHHDFDFCDTSHCQFLREPPPAGSPAARAAWKTAGLTLAFRGEPIAALYSASCGGRTQSLADAGLHANDGYPYFSVECSYCAQHANEWESRLPLDADSERLERDRSERARLAIVRRNGWSAVPGNNFETRRETGALVLHGRGQGHGVGLCQAGAACLAEDGAGFEDILAHYYPGTTLKVI